MTLELCVCRYKMSTKPNESFVRADCNSGAVLNTDNTALGAYRAARKRNKEIDALKEEVKDIKGMLSQILEKLN
jgi:hypothetical protein